MRQLFTFIFLPIILTTLGEFLLKFNINDLTLSFSIEGLFLILTTPLILISILMIFIGGILWLVAMSKYELSYLYPFLSINYVAIIIGSQLFLHEEVSLWRYLSVVFIMVGLIIISRSPYAESDHH